ncbi:MAG: hypothetical protein K2Y18_00510 [Alphaproteobacteria bacterium]|jgi:hypothetical protein|nr:hypothetical protein [Alphaproteobacteria bacterium]
MLRKFIFFFLLITAYVTTYAADSTSGMNPAPMTDEYLRFKYRAPNDERYAFCASFDNPFKTTNGLTRCPNIIDLTNQETLRPLIKDMPFDRALSLIKERYELIPEGQVFSDKFQGMRGVEAYPLPEMILPIPAELVALGMHLSPGRKVLVMDGKDGICPFLFAQAGATSVLMSHSDEGEIASFNKRKEAFPECAPKLDSVCCDPLTLLETRPDLKGTIDMFYCAHLLQVLPEENFPALFSMIKELLSPDGFVFFLTNYQFSGAWPPGIDHYEKDKRTYNLFGLLSLSPLCCSNDFDFYAGLYFDQKGHRVPFPKERPITYSACITSLKDAKGNVPRFVT